VLETMNLKHLNRRPHIQHNPLTTGTTRPLVAKRRSTRMALHASIGLTGEDRQKAAFNMTAKATNLNKHGAAVQLNRELLVGSVLTVKNQRGTQISARVVAQISALQGVSTYAIEFVEQDENAKSFWGISFPSNGNN
jgi:hypothetical protein